MSSVRRGGAGGGGRRAAWRRGAEPARAGLLLHALIAQPCQRAPSDRPANDQSDSDSSAAVTPQKRLKAVKVRRPPLSDDDADDADTDSDSSAAVTPKKRLKGLKVRRRTPSDDDDTDGEHDAPSVHRRGGACRSAWDSDGDDSDGGGCARGSGFSVSPAAARPVHEPARTTPVTVSRNAAHRRGDAYRSLLVELYANSSPGAAFTDCHNCPAGGANAVVWCSTCNANLCRACDVSLHTGQTCNPMPHTREMLGTGRALKAKEAAPDSLLGKPGVLDGVFLTCRCDAVTMRALHAGGCANPPACVPACMHPVQAGVSTPLRASLPCSVQAVLSSCVFHAASMCATTCMHTHTHTHTHA